MKRIFTAIAIFGSLNISAQVTSELFKFSNNNFGMATARSAAMGGAFTSLGADPASASINPAGLAMYKKGEYTLGVYGKIGTTYNGYNSGPETRDNYSKLAISNFSAIYKEREFVYGLSFNRLGDFYSNSTSNLSGQPYSITDFFASQLDGIHSNTINSFPSFQSNVPAMWGSMLAFQTGAVGNVNGDKTQYGSMIENGAYVSPSMNRKTSGALDELAFSAAYDFDGVFFIGATLGVQMVAYNKTDTYTEYAEDTGGPTLDTYYHQRILELTGSGVNIKLGATARPADWLRIGLAYHSPTWYSFDESSWENASAFFFDEPNKEYYADTPTMLSTYDASTPSRLLFGASFTIAERAIVSIDYKRTWFNSMSYSQSFNENGYRAEVTATDVDNFGAIDDAMDQRGNIDMNRIVKDNYRATNNISIGVESYIESGVYLRAGYMYQDSPYSVSKLRDYGKLSQTSFGIGYRTSDVSVDLTYINSVSKNLPYGYYNSSALTDDVLSKDVSDNIMLTIGFRF